MLSSLSTLGMNLLNKNIQLDLSTLSDLYNLNFEAPIRTAGTTTHLSIGSANQSLITKWVASGNDCYLNNTNFTFAVNGFNQCIMFKSTANAKTLTAIQFTIPNGSYYIQCQMASALNVNGPPINLQYSINNGSSWTTILTKTPYKLASGTVDIRNINCLCTSSTFTIANNTTIRLRFSVSANTAATAFSFIDDILFFRA
jgi:hypothetical protein